MSIEGRAVSQSGSPKRKKWGQANLFAILLFREKVNKVYLTLNLNTEP